jgi:hypothetical protein
MDNQVETFYRRIYADLEVDASEASKLNSYFSTLNPPPDKLVWLRSTAFRLGCEFISDDDRDRNVNLLRAINAIVHSLESTCMVAKIPDGNSDYDSDKIESYFQEIFSDLTVNQDENQDLINFFEENIPPSDSLVSMRAAAFKAAVDCLAEEKESNVSLLRCINSVVHCFEMTCYKYVLSFCVLCCWICIRIHKLFDSHLTFLCLISVTLLPSLLFHQSLVSGQKSTR